MAEFRIVVRTDTSQARAGLRQVERSLDRSSAAANALRLTLSRAFAFLGGAFAVRQLVQFSDEFTNLQNRLGTVTSSTEELAQVTEALFQVANRTRSSFAATVEVFARAAAASRDLGVSNEQLLGVVETLNQTVTLSGATVQEATNALIQLSQGLGAGALRGDEFRSVNEQIPAVMQVIARSLGVARGELRLLAEQGRLTTDVIIRALVEAREEIAGRFARTVPTVSQALVVLRNNLVLFTGAAGTSTGASRLLAQSILQIAAAVQKVVGALEFFAPGGPFTQFFARQIKLYDQLRAVLSGDGGLVDIEREAARVLDREFGAAVGKAITSVSRLNDQVANVGGAPLAAQAAALSDAQAKAVEDVVVALEAEASATRDVLELRGLLGEAGARSAAAELKLASAGVTVDDALRDQLLSLNVGNLLLADQADLLAQVTGDQERFNRTLSASKQLKDLDAEAQRRLNLALLEAQVALGGAESLTAGLALGLARVQDELNNVGGRVAQETVTQFFNLRGAELQLADVQLSLNNLLKVGLIDQRQFNSALLDAEVAAKRAEVALGGTQSVLPGLELGLLEVGKRLQDVGSLASETLVNAFGSLEDALVSFVRTGKLSFEDFANSLLDDVARLLVRLLLLQAATGVGGAVGGALGLVTAAQHGGRFGAGEALLVGEAGPELFMTPRAGEIVPAPQTAAVLAGGGEPVVNVDARPSITNVVLDDPDLVPGVIASGRADREIVNLISRNRALVRRALG